MAHDQNAAAPTPSTTPTGRSKAARYGIPAAIAGAVALTVGMIPAIAAAGTPDLPQISAQKLLAKVAAAHPQQMSGTLTVDNDLGLPQLPASLAGGDLLGGLAGGKGKQQAGVSPQQLLMQLASGEHTVRIAHDGDQRQSVALDEKTGDYRIVHNGKQLWLYDGSSRTALHTTEPAGAAAPKAPTDGGAAKALGTTPAQFAQQALAAAKSTTKVSVGEAESIAGRDAYQLVLTPKNAPYATVGSIRIGVDAKTGTPLKFTVNPKGGGKALVDVAFSKVDFTKPAASAFAFKAPRGTKIVNQKPAAHAALPHAPKSGDAHKLAGAHKPGALLGALGLPTGGSSGVRTYGTGWGTVLALKGDAHTKSGKSTKDGAQALGALGTLSDQVKGAFGKGQLFHTRVASLLITDNGTIYAGPVTPKGLLHAANQDARH